MEQGILREFGGFDLARVQERFNHDIGGNSRKLRLQILLSIIAGILKEWKRSIKE